MTLKSIISPLAVAAVFAVGSALPASAAIFDRGGLLIFEPDHQVTQSNLTPAQRTQLADQCRQLQSDSDQGVSGEDDDVTSGIKVTPEYCHQIGIV